MARHSIGLWGYLTTMRVALKFQVGVIFFFLDYAPPPILPAYVKRSEVFWELLLVN